MSLLLWLALAAVTPCCCSQWLHQIYVDSSQTGVNDSSCWEGGYSTPCLSLNLALKGAQHYNHSIAILLQPGQNHLHSGSETQLRNMLQLAIVGNGSEGDVVITCQPLAGLAFFQSENIEMRNVSMIGCGALQNSTSINSRADSIQYLQVHVAVQFDSCRDVSMHFVLVNRSTGLGIAIYNSVGMIHIDNCYFLQNGKSLESYGGGGLTIEFSNAHSSANLSIVSTVFEDNMANSGDFSALTPSSNPGSYFGLGRGGGLSIVLREGAANNIVQLSGVRLERNTAQFGGGLYLALYGNTINNTITIDSCDVMGNEAIISVVDIVTLSGGGGIFVAFPPSKSMSSMSNAINISTTQFTSNVASYGGGFSIEIHNELPSNTLLVENCTFRYNSAFQGSSAYFYQDSNRCPSMDTMITKTTFSNGQCSAGIITQFALQCSGNVYLQRYSILLNDTIILRDNGLSGLTMSSSHVELLPGTQLHFINNTALEGAGLHLVDCSAVIVSNNSAIYFDSNNAAMKGGAIHAENCGINQNGGSQCFVRHGNKDLHPDNWEVNFTFVNNTASGIKNSIHVNSIRPCIWTGRNYLVEQTFCWKRWSYDGQEGRCLSQLQSDPAFVYTSAIGNITVFPGETINLMNVKVTDDWGRDMNQSSLEIEVLSGPVLLQSGQSDPKRRLTTQLQAQSITLLAADCNTSMTYYQQNSVLSIGPSRLSGIVNVEFKSCNESSFSQNDSICSIQDGCLQTIQDEYSYCSNGLECTLIFNFIFFGLVNCELNFCPYTSSITIPLGACMSQDNNTKRFYTGRCPTTYRYQNPLSSDGLDSSLNTTQIRDLFLSQNINNMTCDPHRDGRLCGRCTEGYGVAFNSPNFICVPCESYAGAVMFVLLGILPVFVMMTILAVLHINITDGYLNGFILYSQLITLQFPGLGYPSWVFSSVYRGIISLDLFTTFVGISSIYSIWNLNFLTVYPPFCIPHVETAAAAIGLQYVMAFCPLVFIAVTYTWIELYSRGFKFVHLVTKVPHKILARFWQKFNIQPSLIDTYAGLLVLSFMRFLAVSVKTLQYTFVVDFFVIDSKKEVAFYYDASMPYFGLPHGLLGTFGLLCLVLFVFPLIITFLFYHLKIFQKCLSLCKLDRPGLHALVDAYQGCFKNSARDGVERRFFAGIYLLFRAYIIVIALGSYFVRLNHTSTNMLVLVIESSLSFLMAGLVVLLRPYKRTSHNVIDFFLFFFMSLIAALSLISMIASNFLGNFVSYLPAVVLLFYLIFKLVKSCCVCVRSRHSKSLKKTNNTEPLINPLSAGSASEAPRHVGHSNVALSSYIADDMFADRMLNPSEYIIEEHTQYHQIDDDTENL